MTATPANPAISVVIPTRDRPELLPRAIESVLAQRFTDFELIISDDEDPPGESRLIAQRYAASDPRIRVIANPGPHGQAANLNAAMGEARAPWIKPLYDDDELEPACLERLLSAAMMSPNPVAIVRCLARRIVRGRDRGCEPRGRRALVEELDPAGAVLAQYLQDVDVGIPSQMLVSRRAIEAGAWMPADPGLVSGVDSAWTLALLGHGSLVLLNEPLVRQHQGTHETITSRMSDRAMDAEFARLREMQFAQVDPALAPPPVETVQAMLRAIRAMQRARNWHPAGALRLAASVRSLRAWTMAGRWALGRLMPGRLELVPRTRLSSEPTHDDARRNPGVRIHAQRTGAHDGVSHARDRRAAG